MGTCTHRGHGAAECAAGRLVLERHWRDASKSCVLPGFEWKRQLRVNREKEWPLRMFVGQQQMVQTSARGSATYHNIIMDVVPSVEWEWFSCVGVPTLVGAVQQREFSWARHLLREGQRCTCA